MKSIFLKILFLIIGYCLESSYISAQNKLLYTTEQLKETKWRYDNTLHVESNTAIHKANYAYQYFLYFRFDNSYQQFLNGNYSMGAWRLQNNVLDYSFDHVDHFKVIKLTSNELVLEFNSPNSRGLFQYHFVNAEDQHPFPKPVNELPTVKIIERKIFSLPWWNKKKKESRITQSLTPPVYMNIELTGGGYSCSIDPIYRDYIWIKPGGRLIREFQSKSKGLIVTKKTIPIADLERLCQYAENQHFFEWEREYDCLDLACQTRKKYKPSPIPLRISIAYGNKKKVITIAIWGLDERKMKYVNYPAAMDNIIEAIQKLVY
ncbi:MAG: hypothetical protein ACOYOA_00965 [Saprospiraceae bacterium]